MTPIHLAETRQGAGQQFLGKCYLKGFHIVVPKFYKQIHTLLKANEEPGGFLENIRAFNLNDFEAHPTTLGQQGQLWYSLPWVKEWGMSLEEALKAYRGYVSDPLPVKLYFQLEVDNAHCRTPLLMTTQHPILCSQMKCYQL